MSKWKSHLYAILPHPTEAKVLMLSHKTGCSLPHVCVNDDLECDDIPVIKKEFEQKLGISVNILYCASNYYDESKREIHGVYVLKHNDSITKLNIGSWTDLETLRNLSFKFPEHKSIIEKYLTEIENNNIPELRPPWAKTGWFDSASQWIESQLLDLNYQQLSSIECIKTWGISCILRVSTNHGNLYLKEASTLPLFCNEPVVTKELAKLFPEHIPTVLSINSERHWMLLADFGEPIGRKSPVKIKKDVYRLLAQIQIKSVEHIDNLLNVGCLDRRLEKLASQIDSLFNDEIVLFQLKEAEIKQLQTLAPHLKSLCSQLADYKIPQTLVHGDLHLGNVALNKDNYLLFDWTDSCIAHPFFDMFQFCFRRYYNPFSSIKAVRNEYLNQWTVYESKSRVLEAWKLAKPLCALHHAVTYQYISNCLEAREKHLFSNALGNFLRELLKC
ncbi:putative aminoglycoside phosphotransferase [Rivularia sp. PCC 7116]|uniref:aminoglycoside phosphotransferase family protein n=1 Tax=Rivularia sp. PCC 7116 TaxID=373994 RepID=UPI00029F4C76|nr:aminoglycoside phosphotransferase family protein [Rivularia sp. PCC 7116]AFY58350.1 putative aminoglycoside phosphotransferase [Rivularia sp. PCC 7116]